MTTGERGAGGGLAANVGGGVRCGGSALLWLLRAARSCPYGPSTVETTINATAGGDTMTGGEDDRQAGDGQVGGPYSCPGQPGNPMPEPDDTDEDDD